jgi:hypothetical protein
MREFACQFHQRRVIIGIQMFKNFVAMSLIRVIPTLLLKGKGLVKTVNFKNPNYLGDPTPSGF